LSADNNIQVCYPSVPAQYFHLLRRQILRPFRKPLILMMPKSMLRDARSSSPKEHFESGTFDLVLDDEAISTPQTVERVVFCTGKVFFAVQAKRDEEGLKHVALIRVEQLYPFPDQELRKVIAKYSAAKEFIWLQEEPKNMGSWTFMENRLRQLLPQGAVLGYRGRKEASSPATGIYRWHLKEEEDFVKQTLSPVV
jgi:2-oxoglutarate dehydrogenase complex dehydrogenase (E1) component-like enzyme